MNELGKALIFAAAAVGTVIGVIQIFSKAAADNEESFFPEHAENMDLGVNLSGINHFEKKEAAPTVDTTPVEEVDFEDEQGNVTVAEPKEEEEVYTPVFEEEPNPDDIPDVEPIYEQIAPEPIFDDQPILLEEANEEPAEEPIEEPIEEPAEEPVEEPAEEPAEEPEPFVYVPDEEEPKEEEDPLAGFDFELPEFSADDFMADDGLPEMTFEDEPQADFELPENPIEEYPELEEEPEEEDEDPFVTKYTQSENTILVGNAIVSKDPENGFIRLVAKVADKNPEDLVVFAAPNTTLMVFSFIPFDVQDAETLDEIYFVSKDGTVSQAQGDDLANVMAFGRAVLTRNDELKNFLRS